MGRERAAIMMNLAPGRDGSKTERELTRRSLVDQERMLQDISSDESLDILTFERCLDYCHLDSSLGQRELHCVDQARDVVTSWRIHRYFADGVEAEGVQKVRFHNRGRGTRINERRCSDGVRHGASLEVDRCCANQPEGDLNQRSVAL